MSATLSKAPVGKRFLALVIDSALVFVVGLIPVLGAIIGIVYTLTKDFIIHNFTKDEEFRGRSVGKRVMGLRTVKISNTEEPIDLVTSLKRNFTLVIGVVLAAIISPIVLLITGGLMQTGVHTGVGVPMFGVAYLIGLLVIVVTWGISMVPIIIESILVLTNKEGRRIGDNIGGTQVIEG